MKITKKEVRTCEHENKVETVLFLEYTHYGKKWEIQVRDFDHLIWDDNAYDYIVKQLRKQVSNAYKNNEVLESHHKTRLKT